MYKSTSGVPSLDRAAVAAISSSSPFTALPQTFKANEIELTATFVYADVKPRQ